MSTAVIEVADLDVYYGTSQILFGVGLSVRPGETMALLGRNGAGKSTTMKAIMGLAPPRRGRISLRGAVISGRKPHHIARAGLGFVPEDRQIFPEHTVEDNLVIGAKKGPNGEDEWSIRRIRSGSWRGPTRTPLPMTCAMNRQWTTSANNPSSAP